ncbi:MAG: flippase-like domain-containing protein [Thermodesulfovibrionales bacterium]|nr:flippase-like domain-containing protein [Thermodesulfovibrionales bacterium]
MVLSNKKIRTIIFFLLKLAVSISLLYLLFSKLDITLIKENLTKISPIAFVSSASLYIFSLYLSSIRWSLLIDKLIPVRKLFSLYSIGAFFNICLPGIIGGDAIKVYYLNKALNQLSPDKIKHGDKTNLTAISIASVFLDRYIGFFSLLCIGIVAFPFSLPQLHKEHLVYLIAWLLPLFFVVFVSFSFLIFWQKIGLSNQFLAKIYNYFSPYRLKNDTLLKTFLYSFIIQLTVIISIYILSNSLLLHIPLFYLFTFIPLILLTTLLPISISGLGVREFSFIFFLGGIGVSPESAITLSLSWFFSVIAGSLWGFFEYLKINLPKKKEP